MPKKKDNDSLPPNDHLNDEDRMVWKRISDTTKPLKQRPEPPQQAKRASKSKPAKNPTLAPAKARKTQPSPTPSYTPIQQIKPVSVPIPGVDKSMKRKLGRGQVEIDARLDLHGKTKAVAHPILKSFLINAQSRGHRTVLIITGKGGQGIARHTLHSFDVIHTPERTGVLMRSVPQWLNEPDFRDLIIGFQPAHPKHGGGGALYVRIRRKRVLKK